MLFVKLPIVVVWVLAYLIARGLGLVKCRPA